MMREKIKGKKLSLEQVLQRKKKKEEEERRKGKNSASSKYRARD